MVFGKTTRDCLQVLTERIIPKLMEKILAAMMPKKGWYC